VTSHFELENGLPSEAQSSIERVVGKIVEVRKPTGGYSASQRWIITTASGKKFFVKVGTTVPSRENIQHEIAIFERLHLACMPRALGWERGGEHPFLLLEDLSSAFWPPPWTPQLIEQVVSVVKSIHCERAQLDDYSKRHGGITGWWQRIARDHEPFLQMELVSADWLERALPKLIESESACSVLGQSVCHFDLRSDNLCLSSRGVVVIDWSHACLGNPDLDLGLFLPGLTHEGGPQPEHFLPGRPDIAAWVSGFFAVHAGKPVIPTAPLVRVMQRQYLETSLAWVTKALAL
jgi:aminoglycoside phosphotransferase (APT) family kinase protein